MVEILVPLSFFLMVFSIVYVALSTQNKERMALIERGADPSLFKSKPKGSTYSTFKWGLFMVGLAAGIFLGMILSAYTRLEEGLVFSSMILLCGGIALMVAYLLRGRLEKKPE